MTLPDSYMEEQAIRYPALTGDPNAQGMLEVSRTPPHKLHWEEWGNPKGEPVVLIHGGPGGGITRKHARIFDPAHYRIILFDQRGCGHSEPHASVDPVGGMAGNHTSASVADIEKLREHLGIDTWRVHGGSWGSTLGLAYAEHHPERVKSLTLRGIFLCDKTDLSFFYQGNAASPHDQTIPGAYRAYLGTGDEPYTVPPALRAERMANAFASAWQRYVAAIPEAERGDMIATYNKRFTDPAIPEAERHEALMAWSHWEDMTSILNYDLSEPSDLQDPHKALAFSRIENGYFHRALQGGDPMITQLLSPQKLQRLKDIPIDIVHGKYDQVCVVESARKLREALRAQGIEPATYLETTGGHALFEKETYAAVTDIFDRYAQQKQWRTTDADRPATTRGLA